MSTISSSDIKDSQENILSSPDLSLSMLISLDSSLSSSSILNFSEYNSQELTSKEENIRRIFKNLMDSFNQAKEDTKIAINNDSNLILQISKELNKVNEQYQIKRNLKLKLDEATQKLKLIREKVKSNNYDFTSENIQDLKDLHILINEFKSILM